jgi:hypothetical protein
MFRRKDNLEGDDRSMMRVDQILREGLRSLPYPTPSVDFDERVLAGLHDSVPWHVALRNSLKPMLAAMTGSFLIGLLAIHFALQTPTPNLSKVKSSPINYEAMQRLIDSPNLSTLDWWRYSLLSIPPPRPPERMEAPALNHSEISPSHNQATV